MFTLPKQELNNTQKDALAKIQKFLSSHIESLKRRINYREIKNRQGFHPREASRRNLLALRQSLRQEVCLPEKISKNGVTSEENVIFDLITNNITLKHATTLLDITIGNSLKSIKKREIDGEIIENSRTLHSARQHFVYFVLGIGNHPTPPGLENLPTVTINLKKLANYNLRNYNEMHLSPHLSDFLENSCAPPILLGEMLINMQCINSTKEIVYTFHQTKNNQILKKKFKFDEFVFSGGKDLAQGIAYRFIELLRYVGNPYRQYVFTKILDPLWPEENKINFLGKIISALMPSNMLLEAKISDELILDNAYTIIIPPLDLESKKMAEYEKSNYIDEDSLVLATENSDEEENLYNLSSKNNTKIAEAKYAEDAYESDDFLKNSLAIDDTFLNSLVEANNRNPYTKKDILSIVKSLANERVRLSNAKVSICAESTNYLPTNLSRFFKHVLYSKSPEAEKILLWMLNTSFMDEDNQTRFYLHVSDKNHPKSVSLIQTILENKSSDKYQIVNFLKVIFPKLNPLIFSMQFCYYVAIAASQSSNPSKDEVVLYLLSHEIDVSIDNIELKKWIGFKKNKALLEYLFEKKQLNINALCDGAPLLEYALKADNHDAISWMLDRGADISLCKKEVVQPLEVTNNAFSDAVVIVVTGKTRDQTDHCVVLGRRRLTTHNNDDKIKSYLEAYFSFPGGEINKNETPKQACIRELKEETCLIIDEKTTLIHEIARIQFSDSTREDIKINSLFIFHIDIGKFTQPVYSNSDLADVRKVRLNNFTYDSDNIATSFHGKYFRRSNAIILQHVIENKIFSKKTLSFLSDLIYAEIEPCLFFINLFSTWSDLNNSQKNETKKTVKTILEQEYLIIDDPSPIITMVILTGDVELIKLFSAKGINADGFSDDTFLALQELIEFNFIEMLRYIKENMPNFFVCRNNEEWLKLKNYLEKKRDDVPSEISAALQKINQHQWLLSLLSTVTLLTNDYSKDYREDIKNEIMECSENFSTLITEVELYLKLALLTGDVALLQFFIKKIEIAQNLMETNTNIYQLSGIEAISLDLCDEQDTDENKKDINIIQFLFEQDQIEMLQFLSTRCPKSVSEEIRSARSRHFSFQSR